MSNQDKIQQMINFINSEAQDQANIINVKANEEYAIEKLNLVETAKARIRNQYKLKEKEVEIEKQM
jgi:V-type H+-transporting ATPase subunit E